jgi:hypothetical protein
MANPNIVDVTTINGKIAGQAILATPTAAIVPAVATGHVAKVNALYVSNVDGINPAELDVYVNDGTTDWNIASTITVSVDTTIDVISKSIYLEETWSLWVKANTDGYLEAVASWEDITDL